MVLSNCWQPTKKWVNMQKLIHKNWFLRSFWSFSIGLHWTSVKAYTCLNGCFPTFCCHNIRRKHCCFYFSISAVNVCLCLIFRYGKCKTFLLSKAWRSCRSRENGIVNSHVPSIQRGLLSLYRPPPTPRLFGSKHMDSELDNLLKIITRQ